MGSLNPNAKSMYDVPVTQDATQEAPLSAIDAQFMEFKTKGNLDPGNPRHAAVIESMMKAISSGMVSERSVRNMALANEAAAPLFLNTYDDYKRQMAQRQGLSNYFNPGSPETVEPMGPPTSEGHYGTKVNPAVEPKADFRGAITWMNSTGNLDAAKKLTDQMKDFTDKEEKNQAIKLAKAAAGVPVDKPLSELTTDEARRVSSFYSPANVVGVPGGSLILPRGAGAGAVIPNPTPVPQPVLEDISKTSSNLENMRKLNTGFKDQYAGYKSDFVGNAAIAYKKKMGGPEDADQVEWWQSYQDHINAVRKDLFGSALTEPEKKEFEKAMVTPGIRPEMARRNLARQEAIAKRAASKIARAASANTGYNQQQIREAAGSTADELIDRKPQQNAPEVVRWGRDKNGRPVRIQ